MNGQERVPTGLKSSVNVTAGSPGRSAVSAVNGA